MQTTNPLLSIIITCHNYEAFVGRAIASVLRQDDERSELLVVDDGSTDGSWAIIQSYGLASAFQLANGGAARAGLHALRHARAPFVLFLDADDELAPGSLAQIIPRLDGDVAKLQFPLTPIDERGRILGAPSPRLADGRERDALQRRVLRTGSYVSPPTSGNVFRRDVCALLEEVDYETWVDGVTLFAAPFFGDVISLSTPLGFYRLHGRNSSQAGAAPVAARFRREAERFAMRHEHLRRILARRGIAATLPDASATFFYRERQLYRQLLEGIRPAAREVVALQWLMLRSITNALDGLILALFFSSCLVLPKRYWPALLARRFRPRRRGFQARLCRGPVRSVIHPTQAEPPTLTVP